MSILSQIPRRLTELFRGPSNTSGPSAPPDNPNDSAPDSAHRGWFLEAAPSSLPPHHRHKIGDRLEIGRREEERAASPELLLLDGATISWRHCILTQAADGRCMVRDVSRNGTRLNGRRLVPNVETEIAAGQILDLGSGRQFVLRGAPTNGAGPHSAPHKSTDLNPNLTIATVLVGDIRDYTVLVREAPVAELQQSVNRTFEHLTAEVLRLGGTVKEFPGDAILAFWEGGFQGPEAIAACRAALELDRLVRRIAIDRTIWSLRDHPLRMDWALATGDVVIDSFGGDTPIGLSMVGEPVVLACRLEKFANDQTGRILTCPTTRQLVAKGSRGSPDEPLQFVNLGPMHAKGFDRPDIVFALQVPEP